ncbi:MAG: lytic murein transglycosylase, partial [Patescibacteria group bacterium]|nr:lytic murein transglycosylase [Patescibacteria group bacterium]
KQETEKEKEELDQKKNQELDAKHEVEVKKEQVKEDEVEKQKLLNITKQNETAYAQVLAERQQRAAEIYARLFPLRDTAGIQFGEAVGYAKAAAGKTGVRAVLILAVLSQESDLGKNVGNCLVTNLDTGDGKGKNTGTPFAGVMKAPRDTVPFERITKALGKDWKTTPVSCPQSAGYGGAMGPTQFIPSTWELFESRIKAALGAPATNPWNAQHAMVATGLYLADAGAGPQTYTAERNAACRYFSGSACPNTGGWIDNYANSVVAKANAFGKDIEALADL